MPVVVDGEEWEVMFTDTDGGLAPRAEDPVNQPLNEYQIKGRGDGERKLTFDVKPRWAGLHALDSAILSDLKADHYPTVREGLLEGHSTWVQDDHETAEFQQMLVEWNNRGAATTSKAGTLLAE